MKPVSIFSAEGDLAVTITDALPNWSDKLTVLNVISLSMVAVYLEVTSGGVGREALHHAISLDRAPPQWWWLRSEKR